MSLSAENLAFLKSTTLCKHLSDAELAEIGQIGTEVHFAPGERIIYQDGLTDSLYVIVDGRVEIEIEDVSKVGDRGPRSIIGELAMIGNTPRNANCTALTPVQAIQFPHKLFWQHVQQKASLAIGLLVEVTYHLDETVDTLYWMSRELQEAQAALEKTK